MIFHCFENFPVYPRPYIKIVDNPGINKFFNNLFVAHSVFINEKTSKETKAFSLSDKELKNPFRWLNFADIYHSDINQTIFNAYREDIYDIIRNI